jgi:hypothetical protein
VQKKDCKKKETPESETKGAKIDIPKLTANGLRRKPSDQHRNPEEAQLEEVVEQRQGEH